MEIGTVRQIDINREMQDAYMDYAMSVIVSRALPDVRDGLKPVHRRILYAMHQMGLSPSKKYVKCAGVVGEVVHVAVIAGAKDDLARRAPVAAEGRRVVASEDEIESAFEAARREARRADWYWDLDDGVEARIGKSGDKRRIRRQMPMS